MLKASKSFSLRPYTVALFACTVALAFLPTQILAQEQTGAPIPDFVSQPMGADVKERIDESLRDYRKNLDKIEGDLRSFYGENFRSGTYTVKDSQGKSKTFSNMPARHPLLDSQGVADTSSTDYNDKDSRVIMKPRNLRALL